MANIFFSCESYTGEKRISDSDDGFAIIGIASSYMEAHEILEVRKSDLKDVDGKTSDGLPYHWWVEEVENISPPQTAAEQEFWPAVF